MAADRTAPEPPAFPLFEIIDATGSLHELPGVLMRPGDARRTARISVHQPLTEHGMWSVVVPPSLRSRLRTGARLVCVRFPPCCGWPEGLVANGPAYEDVYEDGNAA